PLLGTADRVAARPKLRCRSGVAGVSQESHALSVFYFPRELARELKIQPQILDAPALVDVEQDAVRGVGHEIFERTALRLERHVDHPDHRKAIPTLRAHRSGRFAT